MVIAVFLQKIFLYFFEWLSLIHESCVDEFEDCFFWAFFTFCPLYLALYCLKFVSMSIYPHTQLCVEFSYDICEPLLILGRFLFDILRCILYLICEILDASWYLMDIGCMNLTVTKINIHIREDRRIEIHDVGFLVTKSSSSPDEYHDCNDTEYDYEDEYWHIKKLVSVSTTIGWATTSTERARRWWSTIVTATWWAWRASSDSHSVVIFVSEHVSLAGVVFSPIASDTGQRAICRSEECYDTYEDDKSWTE